MTPQPETVRQFLDLLALRIVRADRAAQTRAAKRGSRYNPHALALQLQRLDALRADATIRAILESSAPDALETLSNALAHAFAPDFSPARTVRKAIFQTLQGR